MKNLFLTLSLLIAGYTAAMAQQPCSALWMGFTTPNYTATFYDSSGTDPNVTTYAWDFGDGGTSTNQNPTHQYNAGGWYLVCLSIETQVNGAICRNTHCDSLFVGQQTGNCQAGFSFSNTPNGNNIISFSNNSQASGGIAYYSWNFGDGYTSSLANPTHTYDTAGTYLVCLTVTVGNNGALVCTDSVCTTITIAGNPSGCSALFGSQEVGLTASFYSNGSNSYNYQWSFGDSTYSSLTFPSHTYASAGTYYVCLTVIDSANNCTDTYCDTVTVTGGGSNCSAVFGYQNGALGTYFSSGANTNNLFHFWDFGDGSTSNQQNPVHAYSAVDTYYVCLTVVDVANSCTTTHCDFVYAGTGTNPNNIYDLQGLAYSDSSTGAWSEALIYLIRYDSLTQTLSVLDSQITQNGYFIFRGIAGGNYLLKAALIPTAPAYNNYLPTYYPSSLFWYDAATVTLPTATNVFYSIYMIAGNNPGGPGFIGGNVSQGANKQATGDPLQGIQIMLLNMDDSPLQYTYSAADGSYSFDNVAYGTYKIYAEVLGKPTYPAIVTLSAAKESITDVAIVVEEQGVFTSLKEVEVSYLNQTSFYPNPVSSSATLAFNAKEAGKVQLQITNILGQVVATQQIEVLPGGQTLTIDMANQQAGIYFLTLSFENHVAAQLRFIRD